MQNYMRTILSGLQNWINKRLHETVPETNKAHMQLVKDENGATAWEERTHYKEVTTQNVVNLESAELIPVDNDGDGVPEGGQYLLTTPWAVDLVPGGKYTVTYDGVPWECYGIDANEIEAGMSGIVMLGNTDAMGATGVEGGNSDAPFILMCIPNTSEFVSVVGAYGVFNILGEPPASFEVSVNGVVTTTTYKELEEGYLPEAVRDSVVDPITLTIDENGNVTSDTSFETAWAIDNARLQSVIKVVQRGEALGADSVFESDIRVRRVNAGGAYHVLQIAFTMFTDFQDTAQARELTRYITWSNQGVLKLDSTYISGLPNMTSWGYKTGTYYFRSYNGQWNAVSTNVARQELGITDPVDPVFVVTVDNVISNVGTADKTFAEIKAAHDAGQVIVCKYLDNYHHLHMCDETKFIFIMNVCDGQVVWTRAFTITATEVSQTVGVVQIDNAINNAISAILPTPSTADAGKILRVNSEGKYELVSLPNAEEATF